MALFSSKHLTDSHRSQIECYTTSNTAHITSILINHVHYISLKVFSCFLTCLHFKQILIYFYNLQGVYGKMFIARCRSILHLRFFEIIIKNWHDYRLTFSSEKTTSVPEEWSGFLLASRKSEMNERKGLRVRRNCAFG